MIIYYFKSVFRYLIKNQTHTIIHFVGLSIGFAAVLFITLFIYREQTYDDFHSNKKEIFQIYSKYKNGEYFAAVSGPCAAWAKTELPEVKNATKLSGIPLSDVSFSYGQKTIYPDKAVLLADEQFNVVFSFPTYSGNVNEALAKPNSIVLTKTLAMALFGKVNPIGKTIELNQDFPLSVSAILEDVPSNSSIDFHALISMSS